MPDKYPSIKLLDEYEARAHLAAIVDSSDDAISSKTVDGIITSWNRGAERLYGYPAGEALGSHVSLVVPAERLEELDRITEQIKRGERVERLQTVRITKEGKLVDVSLTLSPIYDHEGRLTGVSTIARDISEEVRRERLLRESERRYRTLVEMAPDAVVVHQDGEFVYANCAALGIYGARSLEELQHMTLVDLIHPDEREAVQSRLQQLLEGEEIPLREYRLLRVDGKEIAIEVASSLIDYQGRTSIQIIARDISERKKNEEEREKLLHDLAFERGRFEAVVRHMPVGLLMAEAETGRLVYANEEATRLFEGGPDLTKIASFADYHRWKICRPDGSLLPVEEYPIARAVRRGETVQAEEHLITRGDGSRAYITVNATPIRDPSGEIVAGVVVFSDITGSRIAAKALADSEERLNLALEAAEMGSCDIDVKTGHGVWSRRHFTMIGYPVPESDPAPATMEMWLSRIHPDDRRQVVAALAEARRQRGSLRSEHRILRADNGEPVWVNVMGRYLCDKPNELCRFIGVIFDVTERKGAEDALRRSERRFRLMADSLPQVLWTATPEGAVDYLNAYFEVYTGIDRNSFEIQEDMADPATLAAHVIHPDDIEHLITAWSHSVATGEIYEIEIRIRRADGVYHWHLARAIPDRDEEGRIIKWYGTATDINDLREAQERLRASETKFRWLYESNMIAIFFWDKTGQVTEANSAFCHLVGYPEDDCSTGKVKWLEITDPEDLPRDQAAIREVMSNGICKPYEKAFINQQDGQKVYVLIAGARMIEDGGQGIAFAVDLTDLKHAEQALKESEAKLKLAIETTGLGIFEWDLRSHTHFWSDIAKEHHGVPANAQMDDETLFASVHPEDLEHIRQVIRDATNPEHEGTFSTEYRTIGVVDKKLRWLAVRGRVVFDQDGTPVRMDGACLDITEIVQAEKALKDEIGERLRAVEELRKQEQLLIRQGRLAAMGEMIGNIAHQWRQPLNTLALLVQELPRVYERNLFTMEYLKENVAKAMQVINYMSKTIDGFRKFFQQDRDKEWFKVCEVVQKTVSIIEAAFNELNLKIEVHLDAEVQVFGYPNEFSQVVLNVLVNAKDAIKERKIPQPRVVITLKRENDRAVLTVADNAGGIDPAIIDRIFDPYFTTKGPDKGTGIGLFMSKTIIEKNMNGSLTVRNTDEGAEFRIEV
jgi:PAS domain S-box-containing protein